MKLTESQLRSLIKNELVKFLNENQQHLQTLFDSIMNQPTVKQAHENLVKGYGAANFSSLGSQLDLAFGDELEKINLTPEQKTQLYDKLYELPIMIVLTEL
jgi:hypothetical protein